ncbi:MAG: hypothetical protein JNL45_16735 [Hyphomicrobium sp.]|nr:hypothetical protein [Hyphomicrobium sp.]
MRRRLFPALFALVAAPASSNAVGLSTQLNCASDYYAYCSSHSVGSPGVRKCMRANGPRLSKSCINALIADGEISKTEVEQTKARIAAEKSKAKQKKPDAETVQAQARTQKPERVIAQPKPSKPKTEAVAKLNDDDRPVIKPKVREEPKPLRQAAIEPVKASAAQTEPPKMPSAAPAEPAQHVLTLDQETYEALKSREAYFVVEDDTSGVTASQQTAGAAGGAPVPAESPSPVVAPMQDASLSDDAAAQSDAADPNAGVTRSDTTQGIDRNEEPRTLGGGNYEPSSADNPSRAQTVRDDAPEAATAPASPPTAKASARKLAKPAKPEYPAGKMALGRSESSAPAVRPVPDQSKAWQEFMGNRFNGGSNYEGIDASFSRRSR